MNTTELTKYKNKYLKESEPPKDHPNKIRSGKMKDVSFDELLTKPEHLKYVKFLLFGKMEKITKAYEEDRKAFSNYLINKYIEKGITTLANDQGRFIELLSPNYLEGYVFYFGKYKGKTLKVVLKEDKEYVEWMIRTGLEKDNNDNYWNTERGIDLQCIMKVIDN